MKAFINTRQKKGVKPIHNLRVFMHENDMEVLATKHNGETVEEGKRIRKLFFSRAENGGKWIIL